MTRAQGRAVSDYCRENACTRRELLEELRANGTLGDKDTLNDLSDYVNDNTYDAMRRFLEENV